MQNYKLEGSLIRAGHSQRPAPREKHESCEFLQRLAVLPNDLAMEVAPFEIG